jgi:hypothetical protein
LSTSPFIAYCQLPIANLINRRCEPLLFNLAIGN